MVENLSQSDRGGAKWEVGLNWNLCQIPNKGDPTSQKSGRIAYNLLGSEEVPSLAQSINILCIKTTGNPSLPSQHKSGRILLMALARF